MKKESAGAMRKRSKHKHTDTILATAVNYKLGTLTRVGVVVSVLSAAVLLKASPKAASIRDASIVDTGVTARASRGREMLQRSRG